MADGVGTASWDAKLVVTETKENQTRKHLIPGTSSRLTSSSTPDVEEVFSDTFTLTGGADEIDLANLPDSSVTAEKERMRTLKVRQIKLHSPSTNSGSMTLEEGAATAYPILGASGLHVLPIGGTLLVYNHSGGGVIGTSANIRITGTASDVYKLIITAG